MYENSREENVKYIKKCEKTKEGYYWCPDFLNKNLNEGGLNDDEKYFYDRDLFKYKMYFSEEEINVYLSEKMCEFDIDQMYRKACLFHETNKELKKNKIKDKVGNYLFTLEELIDCFEYIHK